MTNSTIGLGWGFGAAGVSVVFFGSNFVPVKKFETGDGMFFQLIMCNAILLVGVIIQLIRRSIFNPFVMIGGIMWATGNICVIPIIKTIGLGLGILIWATFNSLCGWASGRFGWFGLTPEVPPRTTLNYVGVALCAASGILYMFIKSDVSSDSTDYADTDPLLGSPVTPPFVNSSSEDSRNYTSPPFETEFSVTRRLDNREIWDKLTPLQKRIIGCSLAVFSGILYGFQFVPYLLVSESSGHSKNALDYVFAQLVGSYVASLAFFCVYALVKKNKPILYPKAALPAVACGLMWAIADVSWFIANEALGETISFPIITTTPPVIANLWTIIVFREIKRRRNFLILGAGFLVTCCGVTLIVLSKL